MFCQGRSAGFCMKTNKNQRLCYAAAFAVLLLIEILIALFVRDSFIRPYGGDVLVTVLLCCFARILFLCKIPLVPLWVFLFSVSVEVGQYFDFVTLLGLGDSRFFRILLGSTFSWADVVCYGVGCMLFAVCEFFVKKSITKK